MPKNTDLDYLVDPEEALERERRKARRAALTRRRPADLTLALTPEPGLAATGRQQLAQAQRELSDQDEAALRARQAEFQRRESARDFKLRQADLAFRQQQAARTRYQHYTSKDGEPMVFDPRAGRYIRPFGPGTRLVPSHGGAARGGPTAPRGKTTEAQMKMSGNIGSATQALAVALRVGFPKSGVAGLPQSFGQYATRRGLPALASAEAQQTYSAWYNVISPIVHARTGQQMSVQELEREFAGLLPRAGDAEETQLMKVNLLIPMLREYTTGLPPDIEERLNSDLDQAERLVPRTVEELRAMRATGTGGMAPSHRSLSGRPIHRR